MLRNLEEEKNTTLRIYRLNAKSSSTDADFHKEEEEAALVFMFSIYYFSHKGKGWMYYFV